MKVLSFQHDATEEYGKQIEMENTLESMQEFVDGYIELVYLSENSILVCNEEGIMNELPVNAHVIDCNHNEHLIVGNFFVCGDNHDGEMCDVPENEIPIIRHKISRIY